MYKNPFPITAPWWLSTYLIGKHLALAVSYVNGRCLDIGCGEKKYEKLFDVKQYIGLDSNIELRPDIVANGEALPFADEMFDSILSTQVLEHVRNLDEFLIEVTRVLKKDGYLIITVPCIAHLHALPNDFLRFSEFGIHNLFEKHGLSTVMIKPMGGFFTTQCYLWTTFFYETVQSIKNHSIRKITHKFLGAFLIVSNSFSYIVHQLDRERLFPFNYLAIAVKSKDSLKN